MYLMSRRTRVNSAAGLDWAVTILGRVKEVTGNDVNLWGTVYSSGFGTITWTSWWSDLGSMEKAFAELQVDPTYVALAAAGAPLIEGGVDDQLLQTVAGEPGPGTGTGTAQYVASVQAVCAAGGIVRAMTAGVEIAEKATAIGGADTIFVRGLTGPYGRIGWLTGYEDLAAVGEAQDRLAADASWLDYLDGTKGCFVEGADAAVTTLYQRLG